MNVLFAIVISYLLGSIPTAYLFGRILKGIDIRQHGSGNVGATNAFRILGKVPGTLVLLIDVLKGALAITVVGNLLLLDAVFLRVILGLSVVIGHNWTVFLNFKGGKGIATSLGVLVGLAIQYPVILPVLLVTLGGWIVVFLISGYVSLASMVAALILPGMMFLTHQTQAFMALGLVFCAFVLIRHIPNMRRLLSKEERRVNFPFKRS